MLVSVPTPQLNLAITPSTNILYEGTAVNLTCSVTLDTGGVNTGIAVTSVWTGPNGQQLTSGSNSRITIVDMLQSAPYSSTLMFTPADDTDTGSTGVYQCSVIVTQTNGNPNVLPSMNNATEVLNITG